MRRWIVILLILGVLGSVLATAREVQGSVLRLHILANSDSAHDQAIKLRVRDKLLTDCGFLFTPCTSAEDAAKTAEKKKALILATTKAALLEQGCLHPVSVRVGETRFPTKTYGRVRLPGGRYTALEIRIGHGDGKNWWCVMYPPLCLTEGVVTADPEALQRMRQELSDAAYAMVTEDQEITPVFRFKLAELLGRWL